MYARRTSEYSRKAPRESGKDGSSGKAPGLLTGMPLPGLVGFMEDLGFPAYRGRQVFAWLHGKLATSFDSMTDLPASLRSELSECCALTVPQVRESLGDVDGTVKLLLGLADGLAVESVLIPGDGRLTACLSTQVGCPLGCRFCMTGKAGYRRNLRADEIVAQLHSLQRRSGARVSNVVYMGMGEPLLNFEALADSIFVFTERSGAGIGTRHMTVSTVGIPAGMARLERLPGQVGLALSLHSAVQSTRERLVPAAARWRLPEVRSALEHYSKAVNRSVTIEYCLIAGVNDSRAEADALREFTRGLDCKVNLMAWNTIQGLPWRRPSDEALAGFAARLSAKGPAVTVRKSRGSSISGACGQLGASLLGGASGPVSGSERQQGSDRHP
jgi:23S rRNA (adenine2503-C2)-methyltransferase